MSGLTITVGVCRSQNTECILMLPLFHSSVVPFAQTKPISRYMCISCQLACIIHVNRHMEMNTRMSPQTNDLKAQQLT